MRSTGEAGKQSRSEHCTARRHDGHTSDHRRSSLELTEVTDDARGEVWEMLGWKPEQTGSVENGVNIAMVERGSTVKMN